MQEDIARRHGAVAGRLLVVVLTRRAGLIRIVTARDATQGEKKRYRTRGK